VARFKPVHLAHAAILDGLCERFDEVLVGLGSSNRYGPRNPFTVEETAGMVRRALGARAAQVRLVEVPDLGHGPRWRAMVLGLFGPLDLFVSANDYVRGLMAEVYPLAHTLDVIPPERRVRVDGETIRRAWARGEPWEHLVPPGVATYLDERGLPERFRREFGLVTLARAIGPECTEEQHVRLG
jgi:nicotinamide-nucleotide adenylyltransferase